jgi:hypothetical protein
MPRVLELLNVKDNFKVGLCRRIDNRMRQNEKKDFIDNSSEKYDIRGFCDGTNYGFFHRFHEKPSERTKIH